VSCRSPSARAAAAALAVAALAAGCGGRAGDDPSRERVRFAVTAYLSSAVAYIARDRGFFERAGLDVELVLSNRDGAELPSLAQGLLDVAASGHLGPKHFNIVQRGGRIRFVAAGTVYDPAGCPYYATLGRRELVESGRLTDAASLRGLRISSERTSSTYYLWSRMLAQGGLGMGDVELVDLPTQAKSDALAKGLLDVTTASEPWVTRFVAGGHAVVWKPVSEILPNQAGTFLIFGRRLLDERPDLGRRFLAAWQEAVAAYLDEGKSERHLEIVSRATRFDRAELEAMCWPPWSRDGWIDPAGLEAFQSWALGEGLIDAVVPVDRMVDTSFLPAAAGSGS
jgi:NitT/TauT family transport system substrate-binding protein